MKKRGISLILVLCMVMSLLTVLSVSAAESGKCGDNLTWTLDDNGTLTVSGTGAMRNWSSDYDVPWYNSRSSIKNVVIQNGVTTIGYEAFFNCDSLTSVSIPDSVTTIGKLAFYGCHSLTSVSIPDSVTTIGDDAFYRCDSLTSVSIGNSVTTIGKLAFYGCDSLTSVSIPDSVTTIGDGAFEGCHSLTSVSIGNSVTTIGENAFFNCDSLTSVSIPDSVTGIGNLAFEYCDSLTSVSIGNSVTTIGSYAFSGCHSLTSVSIPDSVTTIGENAFFNCDGLTSVSIPDGVTAIGNWAFGGCDSLTSINVSSNNSYYSSAEGNLYNKNKSELIQYAIGKNNSSFSIPNSVTTIGRYAFSYCGSLTSVSIPDGVTAIGNGAFSYCTGLMSVSIGNGVTSIGGGAFSHCDSLTGVSIPDGVTTIGSFAFEFCRNLTSVSIGNSMTTIGNYAFSHCDSLTSVSIGNSVVTIGSYAFNYCSRLTDVYYSGSKAQWDKITIESGNSELTNATIHYNTGQPVTPVYSLPENTSGSFNFASGKGSADFSYKDNFFRDSSLAYNHDLARMSIRLALSAFAKHESGNKYGNQYANVEDLLVDKLNFRDFDKNDRYTKAPAMDSVGVAAARKWVAYPDGDYTVIAVAVRGGGYENEWGGNFNVGTDKEHAGFKLARDQVLEFLKSYVKKYNITGNVKLWITGYSRAAATTNLTAAYLDTHPLILNDPKATPNQIITLNPENIYAYCFETPAGVKNPDNKSGKYNNIFSIVNQHDFVPMVAMRKWGYDRYGITKYLPSPQTNKNYNSLKNNKMIRAYDSYNSKKYIVDNFAYYYPTSSWITGVDKGLFNGQGVFLDRTIDKLADAIGSPKRYVNEYQDVFEYIGEKVIGLGKTDELAESFLNEFEKNKLLLTAEGALAGSTMINPALLWSNAAYGSGAAYLTMRRVVKDTFANLGPGYNLSNSAVDSIAELILDIGIDGIVTILKNSSGIAQGHYPELCMAWLDVMQESDFRDKRLRTLYLNCPVDVEVGDSADNLVGAIYNNEVQEFGRFSITAYVDENGQKLVYLPTDEDYSIKVTATDDGEVTYSVQETNGDNVKITNYNNISVKKNDVLMGKAESLSEVETGAYALSINEQEITPEIIEEAVPVEISLTSNGNGNVSGGGTFYKGEYAKAIAMPTENEQFLGWYNGETLVSNDAEYRFGVTADIELTAKFTESTCEVIFLDDEENLIGSERITKGGTVTIPDAPKKDGYRFDGFYKDKGYTAAITGEDVYTEDTTVYAKYSESICSDGFYYFPIDENTAEILGCTYSENDFRIPPVLDGYTVTKLSDSAFQDAEFETVLISDTITEIGAGAFDGCDKLQTINYIGTEEQWSAIAVGESNDALARAGKVFGYSENVVGGRLDEVDYTGSAAEGKVCIDYAYKACVAVIEIYECYNESEIEETLEIEIPVGTIEKEFSIPFVPDDRRHMIKVSFVNNSVEKTEIGRGDLAEFYAERECFADGDYTYAVFNDGAILISYDGTETELEIPEKLGGYPVVAIDDYAFERCEMNGVYIKSLTLPNSLETISDFAFDCLSRLRTIDVSGESEYFCAEDNVLFNKDKTSLIKFPAEKKVNQYSVPDTVKTISSLAFANSKDLKEITIPDSVTSINSCAFIGSAIQTITIPAGVNNIGSRAFGSGYLTEINVDAKNAGYASEDGVLYNKDKTSLVQYPGGKQASVFVVPNGVETICEGAFWGSNIETIIFPISLSYIDDAFSERRLQKVLYYGSEEDWQNVECYPWSDMFGGAEFVYDYVAAGVFPYLNGQSYIDELLTLNLSFVCNDTDSTAIINIYDDDGNIMKTLNQSISAGTERLSIDIPFEIDYFEHRIEILFVDNMTDYTELCEPVRTEFYAVRECFADGDYTYAVFNDGAILVSYDGTETELEIPKVLGGYPVVAIDDYAFEECTTKGVRITSLTLPDSLETISDYALNCLYSLISINVSDDSAHFSVIDGVLFSKDKTRLIRYPSAKSGISYTIPDNVKVISSVAFGGANITEVILPDSITDIKEYAFVESDVQTIDIPSSVTYIEKGALSYCYALTGINVDADNANFVSSEGVLFNKDKTVLLQYPYGNINTEYRIPDGVMTVAAESVSSKHLERITFPKSLKTIEKQAFADCDSLSEVIYPGTDDEYAVIDIQSGNYSLTSANITFKYNGMLANIKAVHCRYDDNKVTAKINFNHLEQDGTLYLGIYDKGKLVALQHKPVAIGETDNIIEITGVDEKYNDYDVKVLCLAGDSSLRPLSKAVETKIEEGVFVDEVLESEHPYTDNTDETKTYVFDGECVSIDVTFSDDTETEYGYDYIYIYDSEDNQIGQYTGTELAGQTITIPGNTVKIRLTSDGSGTENGYRTESIIAHR